MKRVAFVVLIGIACVAACIAAEIAPHFHYPRLVQLVAILIFCVVAAAAARGRTRDWLVGGASIVFGLTALEGICAAREPAIPTTIDDGLSVSRPVVGWGPGSPGVFRFARIAANGHVIFDVRVTINKDLIRETKAGDGSGGVAFFGDSFTFGDGVEDADTLPQSYADLTKRAVPVYNLAFSGWSPAQNLAALQAGLYRSFLQAPKRFVLTTAAWHAERTGCGSYFAKRAPRYEIVGDTVQLQGPCFDATGRAWQGFLGRFAFYRLLVLPIVQRPTHRDVETYAKIVQTFVATAKRDYGVPTTIVYLPYDADYLKRTGFTDADLIADFRKAGADVLVDSLPPIADPKLYAIPGDGHPTGLANRARAKEIDAHLQAVDATPPRGAPSDKSSD